MSIVLCGSVEGSQEKPLEPNWNLSGTNRREQQVQGPWGGTELVGRAQTSRFGEGSGIRR